MPSPVMMRLIFTALVLVAFVSLIVAAIIIALAHTEPAAEAHLGSFECAESDAPRFARDGGKLHCADQAGVMQ